MCLMHNEKLQSNPRNFVCTKAPGWKRKQKPTNDGCITTQGEPRAHALPVLGGVRVLPQRNGLHGVAPVANAHRLPGMYLAVGLQTRRASS